MSRDLQLVLASTSPRRRELLARLGLSFTVKDSQASEDIRDPLPPAEFVSALAQRKVQAVARQLQGQPGTHLVLGADTAVVLNGEILGKPQSEGHAVEMLTRLQGNDHWVYTGVCLHHTGSGKEVVRHSKCKVSMRPLAPEKILRYVRTQEPMDKAGSYGIQGLGSTLVSGIEGDYYAVVGLPLALVSDLLGEFGVEIY